VSGRKRRDRPVPPDAPDAPESPDTRPPENGQLGLFGDPPAVPGPADEADGTDPTGEIGSTGAQAGSPPPAASAQGRRDGANREALAADAAARALAQTEFERPLLVEAGAGTGKTTTLTARILAWSLGPGWKKGTARVAEREAAARPLATPTAPDSEAVAAEVLSRVVAITFTEAAAAEMASRMGEALAKLAAGDETPPWLLADALPAAPERAARARSLLGALDHLVVRTIHAFCRSLLAAHPLEAGLHPELQVDADGFRIEEIAREVVEGRLRTGYGAPEDGGDDDLLALAARSIGPAELVGAVVDALVRVGLRPQDLADSPFSPERAAALRRELAAAVDGFEEAAGGRLDGLARAKKTGEVLDAVRATGRAAAHEADGESGAFEALCTAVATAWDDGRDSLRNRLKDWARGRFNKTEGGALAEDGAPAETVASAAAALLALVDRLRSLDPELLERARRVLGPLLAAVRHRMRLAGLATFHDLLEEARDLLARRPDVARRARRRIDQLLVDELQDTDRLQVEVIAALALEGPPDTRPGLFLVGDPKQSIYGWRNADLRAYEDLWERVRAAGGEKRVLVENFRSVPAILDEVSRAVAPVMVERRGLQPRFEPLVACARLEGEPGFARGPWAPVEYWVSWRPEEGGGDPALAATRSGDATRLEAAAIARDLARLQAEEGVAWGEMALLLRSFSDLDDYLEALRRSKVPFAVTGDRQYYRRREVIDAAALVRAVIDPGDHLALLTVLRSPAVGVPDAALLPLWREGFPRALTELGTELGTTGTELGPAGPAPRSEARRGAAVDAIRQVIDRAVARMPPAAAVPGLDRVRGWEHTLRAAVEAIERLRRSFAEDPADRFVERLRTLVPLELIASARHLGPYRLANLDRFFRRLVEAMESSAGDTTATLRALRRGVSEALEEEEGRPPSEEDGADAVRVMTIHKAKGLDFGHVYLAQLHKTSPPDRGPEIAAGRVRQAGPEGPTGDGKDEGDGGERVEYCLFGAPTPGFAAVREESRRVAAAERVRTLYVAMTRAKQRMVLTGAWPDTPRPRPPEDAASTLDLLGSRFPTDLTLTDLWATAEGLGGRIDQHRVRWVFPALEPAPEAAPDAASSALSSASGDTAPPPELPDPAAVATDSERLLALRAAAWHHSRRPLGGRPSAMDDPAGPLTLDGDGVERHVALASGNVIHQLLENLDLTGAPSSARLAERLRVARDRVPHLLQSELAPDEIETGRRKVEEVLDRLEDSHLLSRLATIAGEVVARELPLIAGPGPDTKGPIGFLSGKIDLLFRDLETGDLVVADYKTNRPVASQPLDAWLTQAAIHYTPQLHTYARALQEALDLPEPPRAELWFLWPDRIVAIEQ